MEPCSRCRIADWPRFRGALGLTQGQFADLLGVGRATVKRLEQSPRHRCLRGSALKLLRSYLQSPLLQEKLRLAGHPHPYPEDLT